ncbi:ribosomal protein L29 [Danaus plexippus plexippus]|uniref:Ribosomal protein L29 n=2 Tax=Danaus plexippus TaxID=13037 RepID=A0A212F512_DANPL|nr:ribosomal protein L29 [Danaus plexippus plexippus]
MDPKFLRNQRFCKKGNLKPAKQLIRAAERKAAREAKAKK